MKGRAWARHLFTGRDNQTHDLGRWSWATCLFALLAFAGWNAIHVGTVGLMDLAQAMALIVTAHGAALWAKANTEPNEVSQSKSDQAG